MGGQAPTVDVGLCAFCCVRLSRGPCSLCGRCAVLLVVPIPAVLVALNSALAREPALCCTGPLNTHIPPQKSRPLCPRLLWWWWQCSLATRACQLQLVVGLHHVSFCVSPQCCPLSPPTHLHEQGAVAHAQRHCWMTSGCWYIEQKVSLLCQGKCTHWVAMRASFAEFVATRLFGGGRRFLWWLAVGCWLLVWRVVELWMRKAVKSGLRVRQGLLCCGHRFSPRCAPPVVWWFVCGVLPESCIIQTSSVCAVLLPIPSHTPGSTTTNSSTWPVCKGMRRYEQEVYTQGHSVTVTEPIAAPTDACHALGSTSWF